MPPRSAILLAAGEGTRLRSVHAELPKGLLEVGGETLVGRSLRLLRSRGVERVVLVVGHLAGRYAPLAELHPWLELAMNGDYATGGSLGSLARGIEALADGEEFLLLESDLYYEPRALDLLLFSDRRNLGLTTGPTGAGDEVWVEAPGRRLRALSKERGELRRVDGELVGVWRLGRDAAEAVLRLWRSGSPRDRHAGRGYETDGLVAIAGEVPIWMHREPGLLWGEIDDPGHLDRVRRHVVPRVLAAESRASVPRRVLLNPGPATTTDTVKQALVVPDVCPREREFLEVLERVRHGLARLAGDPRELVAVPFAASGTGALEAVIGSVVPRDGGLLVLDNGDYGARLAEIARRLGVPVDTVRFGWGEPVRLELVEAALAAGDPPFTHLTLVHHETSTGMLNDPAPVAGLCRRRGLSLIVDAMSSFGAVPVDGVPFDYLVSSANKCIQGMAGLSFVIARRRALERARGAAPRGLYFDLVAQHDSLRDTRQTRFTCPPQVVYALERALAELAGESVEGRRRRYAASHARLLEGIRALGFAPLLPEEHQSRILLAVRAPREPWYRFDALANAMLEAGVTIYPGKAGAPETFRLSVMGALDESDIALFLSALGDYVREARGAEMAADRRAGAC
ncbi:MAG TPA: 2-aminoethylphosphonate--pyruvate transaminase [Longimicrobiaceae bacterium]|nr:2-aminoethylphosphonate--pyruvate transaminase [Longimicrobiaceae bacterium]